MHPPKIFEELPPYREALARGEWENALELLKAKMGTGGWQALTPEEALDLAALHGFRGDKEEAVAVLRGLGERTDTKVAVEALLHLASLQLTSHKTPLEETERLVEKAAAVAGSDKRLGGLLAHTRSRIHWRRSEIKEAGACLEEARQALEEVGDEGELAKVLDSLAMYYEHCGERERALSCYSLSVSKKALWRDLYGIGITLGNLGRFHLRLNQPQIALSCLLSDLQIATKMGDVGGQVVVRINIGQALTELGRLEEAEKELEEALKLARTRGWRQHEAYALKDLARAVARRWERDRAFTLLDGALELLEREPHTYARGQVLLTRGELLLENNNHDAAREAFQDARKIFATLGARQEEASAIHGLARISEKLKQWNSCLQFLEDGMGCLSTIASPAAAHFEETFRRLQIASHNRLIPRTVGPYRIVARIGAGAYGEVYKAFDSREGATKTDVAIKVLRLEGVRDDRERKERVVRFHRECEILAQISHPNVVRLIDSGEDPLPYLVQEFVGGGDLTGLLKDAKPIPLEKAFCIMKGLLSGLVALHEKGIVHRDLKPGNVLLRLDGQPVIADFGIARMLELTALTLQSMVMGTLGYMAPEQIRGEPADERADIYASGTIFFQLLTGRLPYEENTLRGILKCIEQDKPPNIGDLRPDLAPAVVQCVNRCLEKEIRKRYERARDLQAAFEEACRA